MEGLKLSDESYWPEVNYHVLFIGATSYRLDFPHNKRVPNGPVTAAVTKHGMWSMDQFSEEWVQLLKIV